MDRSKPFRISLISLASQYIHSELAVWYLKEAIEKSPEASTRYSVTVVEGTVNESADRLFERILASSPQFLGFSTYIWNIRVVEMLLPRLRAALPDCFIVLGGPEVSHNAKEILKRCPEVDFVISGEGEEPIARLVERLSKGQKQAEFYDFNPEYLPGLCFRTSEGTHLSEAFVHKNIPYSPYSETYKQALKGRIAYIETSRGCPYRCAFCLSGRAGDLRELPLDKAFEEIVKLANTGAKTIKFVDRTFNVNRARAAKILRFLAKESGHSFPEGLRFHFEIAGDLIDTELIETVSCAPAGLFQFEIGLQSMHEESLRRVRRQTDMALLTKQVQTLINCGKAHIHLDLIAGLPTEDLLRFAQSFNKAYAFYPHNLQLGFLKLIHGSAMREDSDEFPCRFDTEPPYEVIETPWMSPSDFETLHEVELGLAKLYNSGRFVQTLRYLSEDCKIDAFEFYLQMGRRIIKAEREQGAVLSLEGLIEVFFKELCESYPGQVAVLRDLMVIDRITSTATRYIPPCLRLPDERLKKIRKRLLSHFLPKGTGEFAFALLYNGPVTQVIFSDFGSRHPVSGQNAYRIVDLDEHFFDRR